MKKKLRVRRLNLLLVAALAISADWKIGQTYLYRLSLRPFWAFMPFVSR